MPSKSILFVFADEQPQVLDGIRQILSRRQNEWDVDFVSSGPEALSAMKRNPVDVIVTDMIMPGMNGVELLQKASELYPGTVRFIQSGEADRKVVLESIGVAHRSITKPVNPETLRNFLTTSLGLRELLCQQELHARIAGIGVLPSPPEIYNQLMSELQSESASIKSVSEIVCRDISLTAKLLQMVNSAFFGLPSHVDSVFQAVNLLGLATVRGLVLTAGTFSQFEFPPLSNMSIDSIYSHSLAVGTRAQKIAAAIGLARPMCDEALMAGMLHDVGKLIMLTHFQDELKEALRLAEESSLPLHEAERKVMKVCHADIGAHLLSLWGLPDAILEPVALHHAPQRMPIPQRSILTAVHIANALEHEEHDGEKTNSVSRLDQDYVNKLGLAAKIDEFKESCQPEQV